MKKLGKFLLFCLAVFILMYVVGAGMSARHTLTRTMSFEAPPERVWSALLSIRQLPYDRSDLNAIDQGTATRPPDSIEIVGTPVAITIEKFQPPHDLVLRTADPDLSYVGVWTLQIAPEGPNVSKLTVVEDAEVRGRFLRFLVRTVLGEDVLIEGIFRAVHRKITEATRGG